MANAYKVLGLSPTTDDETVRQRYLALVRRFPPEREPEQFKKVHAAYRAVRDARARLEYLLFDPGQDESLEEWIEEIRAERASARMGIEEIRRLYGTS